jgi:phosphatidylethanolamine/phosphatidyl-N-methylethanolamine N-methyltransferase
MRYPAAQKVQPGLARFAAQGLTASFRSLQAFQRELRSFLFDFRLNWRVTGAIAPSSTRLSSSLARLAVGADHVLELGAGTGAVTQELFKMFPSVSIQVVEVQPRLANALRRKHPSLDVFEGTAKLALDNYRRVGVGAVVSSLPFRSLPSEVREQTAQSICRYLNESPGSRLVQFTYGLRQPFEAGRGFRWVRVKWVLQNLPPACIWLLTPATENYDSTLELSLE